jgi:prepilin-type N-terminal cleavage/methylation domain-containing protein/prepilin-type processing-associated H-X9-DG protein
MNNSATNPTSRRVSGARAFTLMELLTVLTVIAVLASLLLPALVKAKQGVKAVGCVSNLKQWGNATHLYANDNEDFLPQDGAPNPGNNSTNVGWYIELPLAMGIPRYHDMPWRTNAGIDPGNTAWICPGNRRRSNGNNLFHYCLNENVNGTGSGNRVRLSSIANASTLVWLFDSKNLPAVGGPSFLHTNLHHRGANILFVDGHVSRFGQSAYWNFTLNRPVTNNPEIVWFPNL